MKTFSAIKYYLSSVPTIVFSMSFWKIPIFLSKKSIQMNLKNGSRFIVRNLMDIWVLKEVILDKQYIDFKKIKKDWTIIDIGASIGDFSITASGYAKKIYAFEKDIEVYLLLNKNILINNSKNILTKNQLVRNLDELMIENNIDHCQLLKIDCEGGEYQILNKTSKITFSKIDRIAMEIHLFNNQMKKDYLELKKRLKKNRFRLFETENPVHADLKLLRAEKVS